MEEVRQSENQIDEGLSDELIVEAESDTDKIKEDDIVELLPVTEFGKLEVGDHIAVNGTSTAPSGSYHHHGIYLGTGFDVAEVAPLKDETASKAKMKPKKTDLFQFISLGKRSLFLVIYKEGKCLDPSETVKIANFYVENPDEWGEYNVIRNNCEHFATFCKTKKAVSHQVPKKLRSLLDNVPSLERAVNSSASLTLK